MASGMNDANNAREAQQPASSNLRDSKAAEKAFTLEQSSHASAIARHCQQERDSTHNSGGYAMQRWLHESPQEGPWSAVVSATESADGEKHRTQKEQEIPAKPSDCSSPSFDS